MIYQIQAVRGNSSWRDECNLDDMVLATSADSKISRIKRQKSER